MNLTPGAQDFSSYKRHAHARKWAIYNNIFSVTTIGVNSWSLVAALLFILWYYKAKLIDPFVHSLLTFCRTQYWLEALAIAVIHNHRVYCIVLTPFVVISCFKILQTSIQCHVHDLYETFCHTYSLLRGCKRPLLVEQTPSVHWLDSCSILKLMTNWKQTLFFYGSWTVNC